MDKLMGFAPDAEPSTPGILTAVTNMIPWEQGLKGAPRGATPSGVPALAAECRGAAVVTKLDDSRRIFAGTTTKLFELTAGAWVDSGGVYSGGADTRWSLAQFGNATLASNNLENIQRSSGALFTSIATAPKAKIIFSVGTQIMALNTNDGVVKPDGWHCCATYDETDWTPSLATLCARGRIVSQPGSFVAGGRLGEYAIAYKEKSIFVGQFVGAPSVWDWTQVPGGDAGCVGQDAWADMGGMHFIVGQDNFWMFDGSRPVPVGDELLRNWFYNNSSPQYRYKTQVVCDRQNNVVWVFYCSLTGTVPDKALVYHMKSKLWGCVDITVQATLNYITGGVTIDGLNTFSATIDGLASFSFDSQFWLVGGRSLAAFNSANQLQSLTGPCTTSSMQTGDAGEDETVSFLSSIRLRFAPGYKPDTASVQTFTRMELGGSPITASTSVMNDGKFDVTNSSRWHSAAFSFTGDHRVLGVAFMRKPEGDV